MLFRGFRRDGDGGRGEGGGDLGGRARSDAGEVEGTLQKEVGNFFFLSPLLFISFLRGGVASFSQMVGVFHSLVHL